MKACPALLFVAALGGCAAGPSPEFRNFAPKIANPSAIVAAEIGFNQLAQEKGQWTAFRQTAAKDAVMFVPQPVSALEYLQGKTDSAKSVKWQPYKAFMSCDGKTGVTTGAWQKSDGSVGYFTTIWQFVETNAAGDGAWKWVLNHGDTLTAPRVSEEMIATKVASCKGSAAASLVAPPEGAAMQTGYARDQSLSYHWVVQPDGARTVKVTLWNGTVSETVISDQVAAQK
jgi:hypothetical protein